MGGESSWESQKNYTMQRIYFVIYQTHVPENNLHCFPSLIDVNDPGHAIFLSPTSKIHTGIIHLLFSKRSRS